MHTHLFGERKTLHAVSASHFQSSQPTGLVTHTAIRRKMKSPGFPPVWFPLLIHICILGVRVAPVTVYSSNNKVEVEEFSEAKLSCEFNTEKEQKPRIEWKRKQNEDTSFVYYNRTFKGTFEGRAAIAGATITLQKVTLKDVGEYRCEVSAPEDPVSLGETSITLKVLVPPHTPTCDIPSSALTGSVVVLYCQDKYSIPRASYTWYKDKKPIFPPRHANATYSVNRDEGILTFNSVAIADAGLYHCEASNGIGKSKSCVGNRMSVDDLNVPGIVAGIVILCLILSLCTLGVCYAQRQGYFNRHRGSPSAGYVPPSQNVQDFRHKQSFML